MQVTSHRALSHWNDWEPTHEHFPIPKRDGGKATPDNTVLAHRLCNKLDYSISHGHPIEKVLARIEAAREAAAAANLPQPAPAAEAVAEVFAPEPAPQAKSPRKRKASGLEVAAAGRVGGTPARDSDDYRYRLDDRETAPGRES